MICFRGNTFAPLQARFFGGYKFSLRHLPWLPHM